MSNSCGRTRPIVTAHGKTTIATISSASPIPNGTAPAFKSGSNAGVSASGMAPAIGHFICRRCSGPKRRYRRTATSAPTSGTTAREACMNAASGAVSHGSAPMCSGL